MIFDSPQVLRVLEKYSHVPEYDVPNIVVLSKSEKLAGEREFLESLFLQFPDKKREQWLNRFVSDDRSRFWSNWFELMLYGWLSLCGKVDIEVKDGEPDFILHNSNQIVIEARAVLISQSEWFADKLLGRIMVLSRQLKFPFVIRVQECSATQKQHFETKRFIYEITAWLTQDPSKLFTFDDVHNNHIILSAEYTPKLEKVFCVRVSGLNKDLTTVKNALIAKAKQHKSIRERGVPYVIAIFLQPDSLSAHEIVEAWLGRTGVYVDRISGELTATNDRTGIHYFHDEIVHKSVSGTLVFKARENLEKSKRELEACWIENPFVNDKIGVDHSIFPVLKSFVVKERSETDVTMHWLKGI